MTRTWQNSQQNSIDRVRVGDLTPRWQIPELTIASKRSRRPLKVLAKVPTFIARREHSCQSEIACQSQANSYLVLPNLVKWWGPPPLYLAAWIKE